MATTGPSTSGLGTIHHGGNAYVETHNGPVETRQAYSTGPFQKNANGDEAGKPNTSTLIGVEGAGDITALAIKTQQYPSKP